MPTKLAEEGDEGAQQLRQSPSHSELTAALQQEEDQGHGIPTTYDSLVMEQQANTETAPRDVCRFRVATRGFGIDEGLRHADAADGANAL